jgi:hypothetical protein
MVEQRKKVVPVVRQSTAAVPVRITWKPLIIIGFPYMNYLMGNSTIISPIMF